MGYTKESYYYLWYFFASPMRTQISVSKFPSVKTILTYLNPHLMKFISPNCISYKGFFFSLLVYFSLSVFWQFMISPFSSQGQNTSQSINT